VGESEIRSEIAGQHAELKELLGEIETLAKRFEQSAGNTPAVGNQLHSLGLALYEKFGAHLESEQALLEPALRKAGPEGERLADRLRNEHHEQRELLKYLIARLEQHPEPTILIARELQHFAGFLRFEMAHEEETMLSAAVLGCNTN
jgi:iron-sulfur cluster repair protein YtfE (RIC family)